MSRIGKRILQIPTGVEVKVTNGLVAVKGPKGELHEKIVREIAVVVENNTVKVGLANENQHSAKALWGLSNALIANMIQGVTEGYQKKLEMEGVGYKAVVEGKELVLSVGFSHPVKLPIPEGVSVEVEKGTLTIGGIKKADVGQFAAKIRKTRPVEPYKGKGIRYQGEVVRRKLGKRATATTGAKK